ncbi:MAG: efflux transporter outer membrane subunit [Verrucomicrobiales bacterium]
MSNRSSSAAQTRSRLLDAAESLFADNGFRNVSLRLITRKAGANLAAVNYHFGSKEALVREVLTRVIGPINEERLELLEKAETNHEGAPVPIEEILDALHRPVVNRLKASAHHSSVYLKLAGRCLSEPAENFSETLVGIFKEVVERFMTAASRSLPHLDEADVFWRMHFSVGTMIHALTHEDRLAMMSQGRVRAVDPEDTLRRLIEFTAAGLRAEKNGGGSDAGTSLSKARNGLFALAAATMFFLTGCQSLSPPDAKHRTRVEAPAHWIAGATYRPAHFPDRYWVEDFEDANLNEFVESVLGNNRDLKAAQSRLEIAQANARITGADLYPQIEGNLDGQRNLQNFIGFPFGDAPPDTVFSSRSNRFGLSLDLSWEIDLWGRLRAAESAAVAEFEASLYDRSTAELSLAGQAAKAWFALAEARDQVALARATIDIYSQTETLIRERFERGIDDDGTSLAAQVLLAETDVANAEDTLESRRELVGRTSRQLEVLAGKYPAGRAGEAARLPGYPGKIPTGLPATLLDRRPDLAASERRIAAADERFLEAKRSLLPRLSLTSSYGTSTEDIGNLLDGDFSVWSVAGNLAQPIFQGGRLRANVDKQYAELHLAAAEFEQTALTAFAEVENALAAEAFFNRRIESLSRSIKLSRQAYDRSLDEFKTGTGDVLTVLSAQERRFASESQLLNVRRMRLENRVDLYLALGGSFRPFEPPAEKEPRT